LPPTSKFGLLVIEKLINDEGKDECGNKSHNHTACSGIRLADVNPGAAEAEGHEKSEIGGFSPFLPIVAQDPMRERS
jgi:hypothetical protein